MHSQGRMQGAATAATAANSAPQNKSSLFYKYCEQDSQT